MLPKNSCNSNCLLFIFDYTIFKPLNLKIMSTNRISVSIPTEVITQVTTSLNQIRTLLQPYLQTPTVEEGHDLPKMSDLSLSFVSKVNDYCSSNAEFYPSYFNAGEPHNDFETIAAPKPVFDPSEQLCRVILTTQDCWRETKLIQVHWLYHSSVQMAAKTARPMPTNFWRPAPTFFAGMDWKKQLDTEAV